jgi:hypothetical protein
MKDKKATEIVKSIFLMTRNWSGTWEVFEQMMAPYFIEQIIKFNDEVEKEEEQERKDKQLDE